MQIASIIDHTNIQKNATRNDIIKTCKEAKEFGFRGVCVRQEWIGLVRRELRGNNIHPVKSRKAGAAEPQFNRVKVISLVDPPIGDSTHQKRVMICKRAKKDGADELDIVVSIPDVKHERWGKVLNDLKEICKI